MVDGFRGCDSTRNWTDFDKLVEVGKIRMFVIAIGAVYIFIRSKPYRKCLKRFTQREIFPKKKYLRAKRACMLAAYTLKVCFV